MGRTWTNANDRELLRESRGAPEAFAELYRRHERLVAGFLFRRTRDPELTADLTAETFLRAIHQARQFRGESSAAGWLIAIAGTLHLGFVRRGKTELRALERLEAGSISLSDESAERVAQYADASRLSAQLGQALEELSEAQRSVIIAHVLGEQSYAEVAQAFGVAEATVRKRVSRGLAKMRTAMSGGSA